jgi:hypothetical protein
VLLITPVRADDVRFGEAGQTVVSGRLGIELRMAGGRDRTEHDLWLGASPTVLHFLVRNLALGVGVDAAYGDYETSWLPYNEAELSLSVGLGLNVPLSEQLSLFPQLWLGPGHLVRHEATLLPAPQDFIDENTPARPLRRTVTDTYVGSQLLLPLQLRLGANTYLAAGPHLRLRVPLAHGSSFVRFGFAVTIGRYF